VPIRPDLRHFYGREWRTVTRPRILKRAQDYCEQCGVPNHAIVNRFHGMWQASSWWWTAQGVPMPAGTPFFMKGQRVVRIVLTIAHLDHTPGHDDDANLKALCQWCHLNFDQKLHTKNARETRLTKKDAARPLLTCSTLVLTAMRDADEAAERFLEEEQL
jgi:hypothetical protein